MNTAADDFRVDQGLHVDKVHVWRGDRHVLKGVSLHVHAGELVHVSGPNGTGKTTLLRVATGLLRPEKGTVSWQGLPIADSAAVYHGALAYASHEPALKSDLTALENLRFTVGLKRRVSADELRASLERTGVAHCAGLPARVLSAGQRRRVAMARVLAFRAALWLLDEPFTNLDAAGSALLSTLLAEHVGKGGLALVVAHHELKVAAQTRQLELA
jgi:heme exporter protein A